MYNKSLNKRRGEKLEDVRFKGLDDRLYIIIMFI